MTLWSMRTHLRRPASGALVPLMLASALTLGAPAAWAGWPRIINGSANADDYARALALGPGDTVVAAGTIVNVRDGIGGAEFAVRKLWGKTGLVLWARDIGVAPGNPTEAHANAVRIDPAGDVVAAGWIADGGSGKLAVVKLRGTTGHIEWGGPRFLGEGVAHDVAVDPSSASHDVVVVGYRNIDRTVAKLDGATGDPRWTVTVGPSNSTGVNTPAVVVGSAGEVFVAFDSPVSDSDSTLRMLVARLDGATGSQVWMKTLPGAPFGSASAIALDAAGAVLVGGRAANSLGQDDFTVAKLDADTGAIVWQWQPALPGASHGWATAVAADAAGNVVAAGRSDSKLMVVKLDGTSGIPMPGWPPALPTMPTWAQQWAIPATSLDVDLNGNVFAADAVNLAGQQRIAVVKVPPAGGGFTGSFASGQGTAHATRVDAAGSVFVAGDVTSVDSGQDFFVRKFHSNLDQIVCPGCDCP